MRDPQTRLLPFVVVGGVCGLAWAAALRGLMTQIVGPASEVTWAGTFGYVLFPGVVTGVLLGWAEYLRRTGGRRGWRWLALAPLAFSSVLLPALFSPGSFLQGGVGGGAIAVPVFGLIAGYALSQRGPRWARTLCGAIALTSIPIWALTATSVGGPTLALDTPRGAWVAIYYWTLLTILAMACAIPHRAVAATRTSPQIGMSA